MPKAPKATTSKVQRWWVVVRGRRSQIARDDGVLASGERDEHMKKRKAADGRTKK